MRSHLFLLPFAFSLGFLAGCQCAWLSEITLDALLKSSPSSTEDLPLIFTNLIRAVRLVLGTLQEAIALLLSTNFALLMLLVPLLFTTAALLMAALALLSKVCDCYHRTFDEIIVFFLRWILPWMQI